MGIKGKFLPDFFSTNVSSTLPTSSGFQIATWNFEEIGKVDETLVEKKNHTKTCT